MRSRSVARKLCALAGSLWITLAAASARAEPCAGPGDSVVLVAFTGARWVPELRRGVLEHLRAGLGPAGLRVCDLDVAPGEANVATVELRQNPGERVTATIEVRDGVTEKRVARDIDLSALPDDARALGVSVAADELLRASWIELSLEGAPRPAAPPPPSVRKVVETSLSAARPDRSAVSARAAIEGHTGGFLLLGGDLEFRHWLTGAVGVALSLTLRESEPESSPHGSVSATVFGAAATFVLRLAELERFRFSLEAEVWAAQVVLRGQAVPRSIGSEASAPLVVTRAGVAVEGRIAGPLSLSLRAGGGVPIHSVSANDYGEKAAAISGFEWYAAVGPQVVF